MRNVNPLYVQKIRQDFKWMFCLLKLYGCDTIPDITLTQRAFETYWERANT